MKKRHHVLTLDRPPSSVACRHYFVSDSCLKHTPRLSASGLYVLALQSLIHREKMTGNVSQFPSVVDPCSDHTSSMVTKASFPSRLRHRLWCSSVSASIKFAKDINVEEMVLSFLLDVRSRPRFPRICHYGRVDTASALQEIHIRLISKSVVESRTPGGCFIRSNIWNASTCLNIRNS